ncbi:Protein of unknown function [Cotesia congregata]|uniref:Uncharacterized protein n=1 Tax=Cotesia congregata TaxID=51543 RepID=A0A8J2MK19_COTCN|nr:Protein of unknown function [Cotesia congregata]
MYRVKNSVVGVSAVEVLITPIVAEFGVVLIVSNVEIGAPVVDSIGVVRAGNDSGVKVLNTPSVIDSNGVVEAINDSVVISGVKVVVVLSSVNSFGAVDTKNDSVVVSVGVVVLLISVSVVGASVIISGIKVVVVLSVVDSIGVVDRKNDSVVISGVKVPISSFVVGVVVILISVSVVGASKENNQMIKSSKQNPDYTTDTT